MVKFAVAVRSNPTAGSPVRLRGCARCPSQKCHDDDCAGRPDPERRRRAAVHLVLPPGRLHRGARRCVPGRGIASGEGRDRADPDQLAHVCRGAPADLPGHRHRRRVRQRRHGRALRRRDDERDRHGQRGRATRVSRPRQHAARVDPQRSRRQAREHEGQHACGRPLRPRARRRRSTCASRRRAAAPRTRRSSRC